MVGQVNNNQGNSKKDNNKQPKANTNVNNNNNKRNGSKVKNDSNVRKGSSYIIFSLATAYSISTKDCIANVEKADEKEIRKMWIDAGIQYPDFLAKAHMSKRNVKAFIEQKEVSPGTVIPVEKIMNCIKAYIMDPTKDQVNSIASGNFEALTIPSLLEKLFDNIDNKPRRNERPERNEKQKFSIAIGNAIPTGNDQAQSDKKGRPLQLIPENPKFSGGSIQEEGLLSLISRKINEPAKNSPKTLLFVDIDMQASVMETLLTLDSEVFDRIHVICIYKSAVKLRDRNGLGASKLCKELSTKKWVSFVRAVDSCSSMTTFIASSIITKQIISKQEVYKKMIFCTGYSTEMSSFCSQNGIEVECCLFAGTRLCYEKRYILYLLGIDTKILLPNKPVLNTFLETMGDKEGKPWPHKTLFCLKFGISEAMLAKWMAGSVKSDKIYTLVTIYVQGEKQMLLSGKEEEMEEGSEEIEESQPEEINESPKDISDIINDTVEFPPLPSTNGRAGSPPVQTSDEKAEVKESPVPEIIAQPEKLAGEVPEISEILTLVEGK